MMMPSTSNHLAASTDRYPGGRQHPGASAPHAEGDQTVFDDIQHALVQQRMTTRLTEAGTERLAKDAGPTDRSGVRRRLGSVLIGIGTAIAGTTDENPVREPLVVRERSTAS